MADLSALKVCGWLWMAWIFYWVFSAQFVLKMKKNETFQRLQHTIPTFIGLMTIFYGTEIPELSWGPAYAKGIVNWIGVPVTLAGHAFSIWARIHLGKYWSGTVALKHDHKIVDTGPYRFVRHPIYTGLLTSVLGSAVAAGTIQAFFGFVVMIFGYIIKWKREEKIMLSEFGPAYANYMKKTKAVIPFVY
jgi:protein-S-isoprenylcysteine O-methyltransferase Ste14